MSRGTPTPASGAMAGRALGVCALPAGSLHHLQLSGKGRQSSIEAVVGGVEGLGFPGGLGGLVVVGVGGDGDLLDVVRCIEPQENPVTLHRSMAARQSATPFIRALNGRSLSLCVCALFIIGCQGKRSVLADSGKVKACISLPHSVGARVVCYGRSPSVERLGSKEQDGVRSRRLALQRSGQRRHLRAVVEYLGREGHRGRLQRGERPRGHPERLLQHHRRVRLVALDRVGTRGLHGS